MHETIKQPKVQSAKKYRRMQSGDQCYCAAVNIANAAPTGREFAERYSEDVASLISTGEEGSQYAVSLLVEETDDGTAIVETKRKECTDAADCIADQRGTLCVNNECLNEGNPRITLTWEGDDDLDLYVFTPGGAVISYVDEFDPKTGGSFDTLYSQDSFDPHVESVYFPRSGAPAGTYRIEVETFVERGGSPDNWTIEVFTAAGGAVPDFVKQSTGNRYDILFRLGRLGNAAEDITTPDVCSTGNTYTECCVNQDCVSNGSSGKKCANRLCILDGGLAFNLSWWGSKLIDPFCTHKSVC
jgi:hypothetical protein